MTARLVIIMGPSGCGKSHIASALAEAVAAPMLEGDDYHPPENRAKMTAGEPLTGGDRSAWIDAILSAIAERQDPLVVLACSALTRYVQDRLKAIPSRETRFVLLDAPRETLADRMRNRDGHFMPVSLLDSQLEALDVPTGAIRVDAQQTVNAIVHQISAALKQ